MKDKLVAISWKRKSVIVPGGVMTGTRYSSCSEDQVDKVIENYGDHVVDGEVIRKITGIKIYTLEKEYEK